MHASGNIPNTMLPAFLVGFQRSGTNMTVGSLARSPHIKLFNENHEEAFIHFKLKAWEKIEYLLEKKEGEYAKIALFKPISDTPKTLFYLNQIPGLKVLFCFRHYRDVINSHMIKFGDDGAELLKRYLKNMQDPKCSLLISTYGNKRNFRALELLDTFYGNTLDSNSTFALSWLFMNTLYYDFNLEEHGGVLPICYEMAVSEPKPVFSTICSFLEIRYHNDMVNRIHGKSVKKDKNPAIHEGIEAECRLLYEKLHQDTQKRFNNRVSLMRKILTIIKKNR